MLRDVLAIDSTCYIERGTLFGQSMKNPSLMDVIMSGSGLGCAELLVGGIRVRERVSICLEYQIVTFSQVPAHVLVAIFKIECLCLRLVAVWYT